MHHLIGNSNCFLSNVPQIVLLQTSHLISQSPPGHRIMVSLYPDGETFIEQYALSQLMLAFPLKKRRRGKKSARKKKNSPGTSFCLRLMTTDALVGVPPPFVCPPTHPTQTDTHTCTLSVGVFGSRPVTSVCPVLARGSISPPLNTLPM